MARVSATLTLLLASVSAQSPCTYDDSSCTYTCGSAKFALSSIAVPAAGYFTATGGDTPYYFNLCAAITTITCDGAGPSPACIQTTGSAPPSLPTGSCASIGTYPPQRRRRSATAATPAWCCRTGAATAAVVRHHASCAPTLTPPTATDYGNLKYGIAFGAPAICAGASGGRTGLSYGSPRRSSAASPSSSTSAGGIFYNHDTARCPSCAPPARARPRALPMPTTRRRRPRSQASRRSAVVDFSKQRPGWCTTGKFARAEQAYEVERARRGRRGETGAEGGRGGGRRHRDAVRAHTQEQAERLARAAAPEGRVRSARNRPRKAEPRK